MVIEIVENAFFIILLFFVAFLSLLKQLLWDLKKTNFWAIVVVVSLFFKFHYSILSVSVF